MQWSQLTSRTRSIQKVGHHKAVLITTSYLWLLQLWMPSLLIVHALLWFTFLPHLNWNLISFLDISQGKACSNEVCQDLKNIKLAVCDATGDMSSLLIKKSTDRALLSFSRLWFRNYCYVLLTPQTSTNYKGILIMDFENLVSIELNCIDKISWN